MKTTDFNKPKTSTMLEENLEKQFGTRVNLEKYGREQLEDMRNKLRTRIFQQEGSSKFNNLLANETYQKDKAMLELLNTRIKEMLGEDIKKLRDKMIALSEGKKDVKMTKKPKGSKGTDQDGDGKRNFDDVQIARMTAGGVPKKTAIAKAKSDNFKEGLPFQETMKKKCCCSTKGEDSCPVHGMKESFPTVADAKARHEKEKGTGEFDKKDIGTGTVYSRKGGASGTEDPRRPAKSMKLKKGGTMQEGHKHDADCGCDECMMQETQGKKNWIAGATKNKGGLHKALGVPKDEKIPKSKLTVNPGDSTKLKKEKTLAKTLSKMHESQFKHNVRFVNESISFLLQEDEEGKAKTITAAGDMVNDFTTWMQRVGQYQTKAIIELADAIRADFGAAEAEQFKQSVGPALSSTLETLTQQREAISNAVAALAGEAAPAEPMGMEPEADIGTGMEPGAETGAPDEMNPDMGAGDEFGASDAAVGPAGTTGREPRAGMMESRAHRRARKLAESHSIISKLAK